MIRTVLAATVVALGVTTVVVAQGDPIAARQALMKSNGTQFGIAKDMSEGKRPFDLAAAKKAFATFEEAGEKAKALVPREFQDRGRHRGTAGDLAEQGGF